MLNKSWINKVTKFKNTAKKKNTISNVRKNLAENKIYKFDV
jgi:hypothetical protein